MEALYQVTADGLEVLFNFRHMHDIVTNSTTIASPDRNHKLEPNFDLINYSHKDKHMGDPYGKAVVSSYDHNITCTIGRNDQHTSNQIDLTKRKRARDFEYDISKSIMRLRTASSAAVQDQLLEGHDKSIHGGRDSEWSGFREESQEKATEEYEEENTTAELGDDVTTVDVGTRSTENLDGKVRRRCIKVVEFSDPVYVEVGAGGFADMVQKLTGHDQSSRNRDGDQLLQRPAVNDAEIGEGSGSRWTDDVAATPAPSSPLANLDSLFADSLFEHPAHSSSFIDLAFD